MAALPFFSQILTWTLNMNKYKINEQNLLKYVPDSEGGAHEHYNTQNLENKTPAN